MELPAIKRGGLEDSLQMLSKDGKLIEFSAQLTVSTTKSPGWELDPFMLLATVLNIEWDCIWESSGNPHNKLCRKMFD